MNPPKKWGMRWRPKWSKSMTWRPLEAHEIHPQIPLQAGSSADVFAKIKTSLGCRDGPKEAEIISHNYIPIQSHEIIVVDA